MEYEKIASDFFDLQQKIYRVLKIKRGLELKKEDYLQKLRTSVENDGILKHLLLLDRVYGQEAKVLKYSRLGIGRAKKILDEAETGLLGSGNIFSVMKLHFKRVLYTYHMAANKAVEPVDRFLFNTEAGGEDFPTQAENKAELFKDLFRLTFYELKNQFSSIESHIDFIEDFQNKQQTQIKKLIELGRKGMLTGNIAWYDEYNKFEEALGKERDILEGMSKKSKRAKIQQRMRSLATMLSKHDYLAAAQGMIASVPTVAIIATAGSSIFGLEMFGYFYIAGQFVRYGPTISAAGLESIPVAYGAAKKYVTKKAKRVQKYISSEGFGMPEFQNVRNAYGYIRSK